MKKVLLIILDGFGINKNTKYNAIAQAKTPYFDYLTKNYAYTEIKAAEEAVGLPRGQFGNSEVGHLNIGAGRIVRQDISIIDASIADGEFTTNPAFISLAKNCRVIHLMGLLSDGGVHSHINHILALIQLFNSNDYIEKIWLHLFLDGRDTPPRSGRKYLLQLNQQIENLPKVQIATIAGRYYAMDRDQHYERIQLSYQAIMEAQSESSSHDALTALSDSYKNNISDEFVLPVVINNYSGVKDYEGMVFANFRADRAIQLTQAIIASEFKYFDRPKITLAGFVSLTRYQEQLNTIVAFTKEKINNTLGAYVSSLGLKQLRIAETEKYPHVTFFFNGGNDIINDNESRIMIPSPRDVATYDLKPEMSLPILSQQLIQAIKLQQYSLIIANFANGDMVGHSGNLAASILAVEAIDQALSTVIPAMLSCGDEIIITADHGNCEQMYDETINQVHTQHTTNLVPLIYIGKKAHFRDGGSLSDIAPSILFLMGLKIPSVMKGKNLIELEDQK